MAILRCRKSFLPGLLVIAAHVGAAASMQVERNIVYLNPGDPPRADVWITNPDADTLYVAVEVLEVTDPGSDRERRTPVGDPREADFLVTPTKFIVPPKGRKLVRFLNTGGHSTAERVFRVNLVPVSPPMEATQHAIRIQVGYQVLVLIAPQDPQADLVVKRTEDRLTVSNLGNQNVLLRNGVQCVSEADLEQRIEARCTGLPARRVHPGNVWQLDLAHDAPVEFTLSEGGKARRQRF